eukprot:1158501-Pelagomonas_calceolata.AAC.2
MDRNGGLLMCCAWAHHCAVHGPVNALCVSSSMRCESLSVPKQVHAFVLGCKETSNRLVAAKDGFLPFACVTPLPLSCNICFHPCWYKVKSGNFAGQHPACIKERPNSETTLTLPPEGIN